jgi:Flp pilus assembly protein TadG
LGIDAARVWIGEARLQAALDAAALTAARDINSPNRDANTRAVLAANFNGGAPDGGYTATGAPAPADTAWQNVTVTQVNDNQVKVEASVTVNSVTANLVRSLYGLVGGTPPPWLNPTTVTRSATADRTTTGIELALVFDITLSMVNSDGDDEATRVESARDAALTMLSTLYGDRPPVNGRPNPANKKWLEKLFISVVPFNVTANYGAANTHFLASAPPASDYPASWSGPTRWGGCVEMRSTSLLDANTLNAANGLRVSAHPRCWSGLAGRHRRSA